MSNKHRKENKMIKIAYMVSMTAFAVLFSFKSLYGANDSINVKIDKDVIFDDGFGQLQAEPILKDVKGVSLIGQYNVDPKNGNVEMKFDKVIYRDQIYTLTEPFVKQGRLKNPKTAVLKKDSKIKVVGGSKSEILNILNSSDTETGGGTNINAKGGGSTPSEKAMTKMNGSSSGFSSSGGGGYGSNSTGRTYSTGYGGYGSSYAPYLNDFSDSKQSVITADYSGPTTNSDGSCKSPYVKDGVVGVYVGGAEGCKLFTAPESATYYKDNQPTCQNKIDYVNKTIQIGQEKYVSMDNNKEYKISQCTYTPPVKLSSEIEKCKAIPDYAENNALIQRQWFYVKDNQRIDIGACTPTDERITMKDNPNQCEYRLDFVDKQAVKQTQFFYETDNKKYDVGECVDKKGEQFKYPMYETPGNCPFTTLPNGIKIYQTKLVFNDMNNSVHDATQCRIIGTQGLKTFEEFSGYAYKDTSKQAIRKINQYFIGQGNQKIYLTKDVETNKSYPYKHESCGWVNDDVKKISTIKFAAFIEDTDENKKVYIRKCDDANNVEKTVIPYAQIGFETKARTSINKTLILEGRKWKIYGTNDYIANVPNSEKNIRDSLKEVVDYFYSFNNDYICEILLKKYSAEQRAGLYTQITRDEWFAGSAEGSVDVTCNVGTKTNYATNQVVEQTDVMKKYMRGDGSYFYDGVIETKWLAK